MDNYLQGKVVLVTGVSSGVGWGISKAFARLGAQVVGLARRADRGAALESEIKPLGTFRFMPCDIRDPTRCEAVVQDVLAREGRLDCLINNAATQGERPVRAVQEMTEEDWDDVMATNLRAAFTMSRLVLPSMQKQKAGVLLHISSVNAVIGVANMAAYNASKAALIHLSNTIAIENLRLGVRSNAIILGSVKSEMSSSFRLQAGRRMRGPDWKPSETAAARQNKFSGDPEEYGRALALFCSDDARIITGATIAFDAGVSAGALSSTLVYLSAADRIG